MKTLGRDLHPDRLATTDESGNRVYIHPEEVEGPLRTKRTVFYWVLIFIYLVVPWIYVTESNYSIGYYEQEFADFWF